MLLQNASPTCFRINTRVATILIFAVIERTAFWMLYLDSACRWDTGRQYSLILVCLTLQRNGIANPVLAMIEVGPMVDWLPI